MLTIRFITVGSLKEPYLRDAAEEYVKRLGGFCRPVSVEIKEARLPDSPSPAEIAAALETEADAILSQIPPRAYTVAMCVEGQQMSSPALAKKIESVCNETSDLCFIIGSSYGLSDRVKAAADFRLSVSELTFPHQLMRVLLLESVYRALNISKGTKYHK